MKKINNIQELKNVLSSLNTFEERYEFLTNECEFSQVDIKKIDLEDVSNNSNEELENLVKISNTPIDERQKMRLENIKEHYDPIIESEENYSNFDLDVEGQLYPNMNSEYEYLNEDSMDVDLDFIMSHSLEDAKENLSEFLSDPDGNGMGIHGYDNRIHNIYEKSMETFLEKAKEIVNKKDNITHLEEDNTITIFNKTDNGLEKIATINLDDKDNMIVNISDVKMKTKILDYVEEIQENKIIQVNVSKSSNNYLSDFHKRAQQIMDKETEKNNQKDFSL